MYVTLTALHVLSWRYGNHDALNIIIVVIVIIATTLVISINRLARLMLKIAHNHHHQR